MKISALRERRQGMVMLSPDSPDSPNGYRFDYDAKGASLDANSNLRPLSNKSNVGGNSAFVQKSTSLMRTGIRTNAHVAPAPSPLMARRQHQQLTANDHSITVYNQSYSSSPHISPLTARRPLSSNGQSRPDRSGKSIIFDFRFSKSRCIYVLREYLIPGDYRS